MNYYFIFFHGNDFIGDNLNADDPGWPPPPNFTAILLTSTDPSERKETWILSLLSDHIIAMGGFLL